MTPKMSLEVAGARSSITLEAIIDTGFDGDLCLPIDAAVSLGLELIGDELLELADGSLRRELSFGASVRFLGKQRSAEVFLPESRDSLVGTNLLKDYRVVLDFPAESVEVTAGRRPRRRRKGSKG